MPLTPYLKIKKSILPGAGKGLFTTIPITKGQRIVEYLGKINPKNKDLRYAFVVKPGYVIDAMHYKKGVAQYANDATGTGRISNQKNNCFYERDGLRVYITASKNIKANSEILVFYGKEYWIDDDDETENTNPRTNKMATAKKATKKAAPKKAVKKAAKKVTAKKVTKKATAKKAVAKKVIPFR